MTKFEKTAIADRLLEIAERAFGQGSPEHLDVAVNALLAAHEVYKYKAETEPKTTIKKGS
jgi:hypothetical protein